MFALGRFETLAPDPKKLTLLTATLGSTPAVCTPMHING